MARAVARIFYTENEGYQVTVCVIITIGNHDRLKLTRVPRIYQPN